MPDNIDNTNPRQRLPGAKQAPRANRSIRAATSKPVKQQKTPTSTKGQVFERTYLRPEDYEGGQPPTEQGWWKMTRDLTSTSRGYWDTPQNVAREYNRIHSAAPGTDLGDVNTEFVDKAYTELQKANQNRPWWEWQSLDDTNPFRQTLLDAPVPGMPAGKKPAASASTAEPISLDGGVTQPYSQAGLSQADWEALPITSKIASWIFASGAVETANQGTWTGTVAGAANQFSSVYGSVISSPWAKPLLDILNAPWQGVENLVGTAYLLSGAPKYNLAKGYPGVIRQTPEYQTSFQDVLANIDAAWQASRLAADFMMQAKVRPQAELNQIQAQPYSKPVTMSDDLVGSGGFANLYKDIVANKRPVSEIMQDAQQRLGFSGQLNDMIASIILDPSDLVVSGISTALLKGVGKARGLSALTEAAQFGKGPVDTLGEMGVLMRRQLAMGGAAADEVSRAPSWARYMAGMEWNTTADGLAVIRAIEKPKPLSLASRMAGATLGTGGGYVMGNLIAGPVGGIVGAAFGGLGGARNGAMSFFKLTREAQAHMVMQGAVDEFGVNIGSIMQRGLDETSTVGEAMAYAKGLANHDLLEAEKIRPGSAAVPVLLREIDFDAIHQDSWVRPTEAREIMQSIADITGKTRGETIAALATAENANILVREIRNKAAALTDNPNAAALVSDIDTNRMTGQTLQDMAKLFSNGTAAIDANHFLSILNQRSMAHMNEFTAKWFGIGPDPVYLRAAQTLKNAQGVFLLNSPAYPINNALNNGITLVADNLIDPTVLVRMMSGESPTKYMLDSLQKSMGYLPQDLHELGIAGQAMGIDAMTAAKEVPNGPLKSINHVIQAIQSHSPFIRAAGGIEGASRIMGWYAGFNKVMNEHWHPGNPTSGVGFSRMPEALQAMLKTQGHADLIETVHSVFTRSWTKEEAQAALADVLGGYRKYKSVDDFAGKIADEMGEGWDAQRVKDSLAHVLDVEFHEDLAKAQNADEMNRAFTNARDRAYTRIYDKLRQEVKTVVHDTALKVSTEGAAGIFEPWQHLEELKTTGRVREIAAWNNLHALYDAKKISTAEYNRGVRNLQRVDRRHYQHIQAMEKATYQGIVEGLGINHPKTSEFIDMMDSVRTSWADYYQKKQELEAAYFAVPKKQRKKKDWLAVVDARQELYDTVYAPAELKAMRAANDAVTQMVRESFGDQMAETFAAYRKGVVDVREKMQSEISAFQKLVNRVDDARQRTQMWTKFRQGTLEPMLYDMHKKNIEGAVDLYARLTNAPKPEIRTDLTPNTRELAAKGWYDRSVENRTEIIKKVADVHGMKITNQRGVEHLINIVKRYGMQGATPAELKRLKGRAVTLADLDPARTEVALMLRQAQKEYEAVRLREAIYNYDNFEVATRDLPPAIAEAVKKIADVLLTEAELGEPGRRIWDWHYWDWESESERLRITGQDSTYPEWYGRMTTGQGWSKGQIMKELDALAKGTDTRKLRKGDMMQVRGHLKGLIQEAFFKGWEGPAGVHLPDPKTFLEMGMYDYAAVVAGEWSEKIDMTMFHDYGIYSPEVLQNILDLDPDKERVKTITERIKAAQSGEEVVMHTLTPERENELVQQMEALLQRWEELGKPKLEDYYHETAGKPQYGAALEAKAEVVRNAHAQAMVNKWAGKETIITAPDKLPDLPSPDMKPVIDWFPTETGQKRILYGNNLVMLVQEENGHSYPVNRDSNTFSLPVVDYPSGYTETVGPAGVPGDIAPPSSPNLIKAKLEMLENAETAANSLHAKLASQEGMINLSTKVSGEASQALGAYLDQVYDMEMPSTKLAAVQMTRTMVDHALLNYNARRGLDTWSTMMMPYEYWYTRTAKNWALRALNQPRWLANYARLKATQASVQTQEGFPVRLRGKMFIPIPGLPEWMAGGVYVDPWHQLFPVDQLLKPWDKLVKQQGLQERQAEVVLQNWGSQDDQYSQQEISQALQTHTGPLWEKALTQAQLDIKAEITSPADFVQSIIGTSLPVSLMQKWYEGDTDIGQTPLTRTIQSATSFLTPGGINIEGPLRAALNVPERGEYWDYYVDRMLATMVAEGSVSVKDAQTAMIDRSGAAFTMAVDRVGRIQGAKQFASAFWMDMFPEGEQQQVALKTQLTAAFDARDSGQDPNAVINFFKEHPQYSAYVSAKTDPAARLKKFLTSEIWEAYNKLPALHKRQAADQLGDLFQTAFLNKPTRDYSAIEDATLATWAKALGGMLPDSAKATQMKLDFASKEDATAYAAYIAEKNRLFPGISKVLEAYYAKPMNDRGYDQTVEDYNQWRAKYLATHDSVVPYTVGETSEISQAPVDIQKAYYKYKGDLAQAFPGIQKTWAEYRTLEGAARTKFWKQHPELQDYMDTQEYLQAKAPPGLAQYIVSDEEIQSATLGKNWRGKYGVDAEVPLDQMSTGLKRQLHGWVFSRDPLTSGAKYNLRSMWNKLGQPKGSFEAWLEQSVKPAVRLTMVQY